MKPYTLVARLALYQQLLAAVLIVVLSGSAIFVSARSLEHQERVALRSATMQVVAALQREWTEERDLARASRAVIAEGVPPGVEVQILDARGQMIRASAPIVRAEARQRLRSTHASGPVGAQVIVSISTQPRRAAITTLAMALLLAGVPLLIIAVWMGRRAAGRMLRPLSRMARATDHASEHGEVAELGSPNDPAEVAVMAEAFNRLLTRLDTLLRAERHFTEDAAHELRTPLTIVSGELELALTDPALSAAHRKGLGHARSQSALMGDLVEALLLLRRTDVSEVAQGPESGAVDLSELLHEAARELLPYFPQREADTTLDADDEVLARGQPTLLKSAVRNLLGNALKFTHAGQSIRGSTSVVGEQCVLVIEDGGEGVLLGQRARIFDPFYRHSEARAERDGFGLGLAIIRRVALAHGGHVSVSDSVLGGARFELSLPRWRPASLRAGSTV